MIQLEENKGIPRSILIMMSVVAGLTVANLYYNQPLLEEMKSSLGANEVETNLITVITQAGYAAGLLFVVPLADMLSRCKIIMTNMATAVLMALVIAFTSGIIWTADGSAWCASDKRILGRLGRVACHVRHSSRNYVDMPGGNSEDASGDVPIV